MNTSFYNIANIQQRPHSLSKHNLPITALLSHDTRHEFISLIAIHYALIKRNPE